MPQLRPSAMRAHTANARPTTHSAAPARSRARRRAAGRLPTRCINEPDEDRYHDHQPHTACGRRERTLAASAKDHRANGPGEPERDPGPADDPAHYVDVHSTPSVAGSA